MIKLLVSSTTCSPVTHFFNQPSILIGSAAFPNVDISLQDLSLEAQHLKICEESSHCFAINIANDPFATVNGLPFGKKELQPNDIIELGDITIRFIGNGASNEQNLSFNPPSNTVVDTKELLPILNKAFNKNSLARLKTEENSQFLTHATMEDNTLFPPISPPVEIFSDSLNDETSENFDLEGIDIDALFREVEALESGLPLDLNQPLSQVKISQALPPNNIQVAPLIPVPPFNAETTSTTSPIVRHPVAQQLATVDLDGDGDELLLGKQQGPASAKKSLKDYYLSEYDDVQEATQLPLNRNGRPSASKDLIDGNNWKLLLKIFATFVVLAIIIAGFGYLWISDQSEEEEIKAAKSVADVAMALTYAQIKHIRPQNQNWSDPEFIKNNLTAVLASKHISLAEFDNHGQLTNCPYLLRIYTSNDLSQFLVLAQPAPSVLQWLIPKATVIIDSNSMEMRKITDLKTLNRLLVTANTLDGTSAAEISQLVHEASLIPLTDLVTPRENQGFAPPKALALIHPGAENLVYNAPRYYHLGDDLMKKSFDLIENSAVGHEITLLQQEISALSKYPNMVFYASGGIQQATQGQKALAIVAPNDKFLIAYLKLNSKGKITSSHLLMDDISMNLAANEALDMEATYIPLQEQESVEQEHILEGSLSLQLHPKQENLKETSLTSDTDRGHPVYLQLAALAHSRQQALKSVSDTLIALINKNTLSPQADFEDRFQVLSEKYKTMALEQQEKAAKEIALLNKEHAKIPAVQFLEWVKAAGIESIFKAYLAGVKIEEGFQEPSRGLIDNQLMRIENSNSWKDMEKEVSAMASMLTFAQVPDPDRLITYQNATRSRVIQKLNQFLLSSNCPLEPEAFESSQRPVLSKILQTCWICDPETLDFYLSEFDLHAPSSAPPQEIGSR